VPATDSGTTPDSAPTCDAVPTGWTRVAYLGDRKTTCPSGSTPTDLIENPTAGADACTCNNAACSISQHQSCANGGTLTTYYDDNQGSPQCDTQGRPLDTMPPNKCDDQQQQFSLARHFGAIPPAPTGTAQCAIAATASKSSVASNLVRTCAPATSTSCDLITLADCVVAQGQLGCPAGTAWQKPHVLATDFTLACGSGSCTCSVTTKCTGTVDISDQNDCNGGKTQRFNVDGKCYGAPNDGPYQYAQYAGSVLSETCNGTAPAANVTLVGTQTVCCR
jgi:hypothetical protein